LELGRGAHPASYMVEEIWQELSRAKYIEWENVSRERASQLGKLKYVKNSLRYSAKHFFVEHAEELQTNIQLSIIGLCCGVLLYLFVVSQDSMQRCS
jgi:hypothetical protein